MPASPMNLRLFTEVFVWTGCGGAQSVQPSGTASVPHFRLASFMVFLLLHMVDLTAVSNATSRSLRLEGK